MISSTFFFFLVAIRATSVAGLPYFIVDMADLWLQMKKKSKVKMFPYAENLQRI